MKENKIWDVVIIGSGPASLTAAIYTTRGVAQTLVLGGAKWGGQLMLTTTVDNFPGFPDGIEGPDLMTAMKDQAIRHGATIELKDVERVDFTSQPFKVYADSIEYKGRNVIVATGAASLWLGVPGEEKLIGRGVSSCAPCDAPFFKDKIVAVVGGGDAAMEEALVLSKVAKEVFIIHRRDSFRASAIMQEKVKTNSKIKIIWNSEVKKIIGESKVEGVNILNNQTQEESHLKLDGIFISIGHSPLTHIFKGQLELDEKGYVKKVTKNGYGSATSVDGVFVAGDVHDFHYRQAVTAAAYGCIAALDVLHFQDMKR